jgi:hypothetical protein
MRHTKIIATIGPASRTDEIIEQLISAGVDVCRLNFSHGTHEAHAETVPQDPRGCSPRDEGRVDTSGLERAEDQDGASQGRPPDCPEERADDSDRRR